MLNINSITKGIVIDHITPGMGYEIFKLLELDRASYTVALIMNAQSKKHGRKDIIKIENVIDMDLGILGILDENITINIIEDEIIIKKLKVKLPEHVEGFLKCSNPRCISTTERNVTHKFSLVDARTHLYKCDYCDHLYNVEE